MNKIYRLINYPTYEEMDRARDEYIANGYWPVFVEIIVSDFYTYVIESRGDEPIVTAIKDENLDQWWAQYSPLPHSGEIMAMLWRNADGYIEAIDLVVEEGDNDGDKDKTYLQ